MIDQNPGSLHFRQATTLLRRRKGMIVVLTLLGGLVVAAAANFLPAHYTATAQLLRETEIRNGTAVVDDAAVDTLVELLRSPGQLRRLSDSLDRLRSETGLDLPAYAALEDKLSVFKERQSRLISVTYVSTDPEIAAAVANRAVEVYMGDAQQRLRDQQQAALALTGNRLVRARADLDQAVAALSEYHLTHGSTTNDQRSDIETQLGLLNHQLAIARTEVAAQERRLEQARSAPGSGGEQTASLQREYDTVAARKRDIEVRLDTLRGAAASAGDEQTELRELEWTVGTAEEEVRSLTRRQADLTESGPGRPPVVIASMAAVPERPSSPNPILFLFPALVGSALIASLWALILERTDQRLRSEWEVESRLQVPCVGLVPQPQIRRGADPVTLLPKDPFAPFVEAIRALTLAANKRLGSGKLPGQFLFTGCASGDGATTLAVSFALYASRLEKRVLILDLNFRRPGIAVALADRGDSAAASPARTTPESRIRHVAALKIDYLPPLPEPVDPIAMLGSEEFAAFLTRASKNYDCIVIDSAPANEATETRLLASMVDRVLLVAKWGVTDARAADAVIRKLRSTEGHAPISVVIADANLSVQELYRYDEPRSTDARPQLEEDAPDAPLRFPETGIAVRPSVGPLLRPAPVVQRNGAP